MLGRTQMNRGEQQSYEQLGVGWVLADE